MSLSLQQYLITVASHSWNLEKKTFSFVLLKASFSYDWSFEFSNFKIGMSISKRKYDFLQLCFGITLNLKINLDRIDISIILSISTNYHNTLGWSKSSLGFFCRILWKSPNELFGQPCIFHLCRPSISHKVFEFSM